MSIGLREVIVVLIALIGVYIIYVVARMQWLKRDKLEAAPSMREPGHIDRSPSPAPPADEDNDLVEFSPPSRSLASESTRWETPAPDEGR